MTERDPSPPHATPDRTALHVILSALDTRSQKIVGGLITVMLRHPERVREREWISEQLTHITLLAGEFETGEDLQKTVADVGQYLRERAGPLLTTAFELFRCVGEDMAQHGSNGFTYDDAVAHALGYFDPGDARASDAN